MIQFGQATSNSSPVTLIMMSIRLGEITGCHLGQWGPKPRQCPPHAAGVVLTGLYPKIDVERGAHVTMDRERMGADDEILNVFVAKSSQNLDKMRVHPMSRP